MALLHVSCTNLSSSSQNQNNTSLLSREDLVFKMSSFDVADRTWLALCAQTSRETIAVHAADVNLRNLFDEAPQMAKKYTEVGVFLALHEIRVALSECSREDASSQTIHELIVSMNHLSRCIADRTLAKLTALLEATSVDSPSIAKVLNAVAGVQLHVLLRLLAATDFLTKRCDELNLEFLPTFPFVADA